MTYKYIAWATGEKQKNNKPLMYGQDLLDKKERIILISELKQHQFDIYQTIQSYDEKGNSPESLIYADFDGEDALKDARDCVKKIYSAFGAYPVIYFSGNKGFHLILDWKIKHDQCHLIAKNLLAQLGSWPTLDMSVYSKRRLWRVAGTYNRGGGCYKTPLSPEELNTFTLGEIKEFSKKMPTVKELKDRNYLLWINVPKLTRLTNTAIRDLTNYYRKLQEPPKDTDWKTTIPPCLHQMLVTSPKYPTSEGNGTWNITICALARFFKYRRTSLEDALAEMYQHSHYRTESEHVEQVFRSTYASKRDCSIVGCRNGLASGIMKKFCSPLCIYNSEPLFFKGDK